MKTINANTTRTINAGATKTMRCRICGTSVTGSFWTRYRHCLKHSWYAVMPAVEFVATCFGLLPCSNAGVGPGDRPPEKNRQNAKPRLSSAD